MYVHRFWGQLYMDIVYNPSNPYADDERNLYFSNPPHIVKTIRNCWQSKHRMLWVCANSVCYKFMFIKNVVEAHIEVQLTRSYTMRL